MDTPIVKVTLLGKEHAITLPNFAAREELVHAHIKSARRKGDHIYRVLGAALGLCTRLGREGYANTSMVECDYDLRDYGGRVYSYLREHGAEHEEIGLAANAVLDHVRDNLFPRKDEVTEARGN